MSPLFSAPPSITAEQAARQLRSSKVRVLDVRKPEEYDAGHISGAQNIPLGALRHQVDALSERVRYIAVCRTGSRSSRATKYLRRAGLEVVNLEGGMVSWERAGLPVDRA
jgi:rhodanese-related sulfurtransferase